MTEAEINPLEQMEIDRARSYNQNLTPLHPPQKSLIRLELMMFAAVVFLAATFVDFLLHGEADIGWSFGTLAFPVAIAALLAIVVVPHRIYRRWGYDMAKDEGGDQLRVLRGFLWRTDTIVPFNRIQHIDVAQGPMQRIFGLSTIIVHTAGTHNSIVTLPGLATDDAEYIRDVIKSHIRKDMI